ncbi:MAG: Mur ligase family protein, partial [Patescibacteria group bacterium]
MDLDHIQKAYFVGVGGIGVSALLRLFAVRGIQIAGSDIHLPPKESLPPGEYFEGTDAAHVPCDAGVLIYSSAVPKQNAERVRAHEVGIPELSYPEALGIVTRPYNTIAVSGTHGKSTTTALLGKLFEAGGFDPSVIVGAETPGWDHNLRIGHSDIFVVEACEYRRNMMQFTPQTILLTNLEFDHPDYYHDLLDVKSAFHDYIGKLGDNGLLVMNNDDASIRDITRGFDASVVRYGIGHGIDLVARNVKQFVGEQQFDLVWKGTALGTFTTPLPGIYNIYNILGALATYFSYRGNVEMIQGALSNFHGVLRRFEVVGMLGGATIITDYAHHPTALRAVVTATLARYQGKKVLVVFRPHHRKRT